jgi:hypothetical protein
MRQVRLNAHKRASSEFESNRRMTWRQMQGVPQGRGAPLGEGPLGEPDGKSARGPLGEAPLGDPRGPLGDQGGIFFLRFFGQIFALFFVIMLHLCCTRILFFIVFRKSTKKIFIEPKPLADIKHAHFFRMDRSIN